MDVSQLADILKKFSHVAVAHVAVKDSPGQLAMLSVTNKANADRYLYVFDGSDDSGTALVVAPIKILAGDNETLFFPIPKKFDGCFVSSSTGAAGVYAASGGADFIIAAQFL